MDTYLEKHDAEKNLHRFYVLSIQPNLFGGWSVIRRWGRIGSHRGRQKIDLYCVWQDKTYYAIYAYMMF
jgi:predicted DNA-binding WGR domain protein